MRCAAAVGCDRLIATGQEQEILNYRTIKDLKDLRGQGIAARYRHLGPKGPEEKSPCHHNGSAARRQTLSNPVNLANLENPAQIAAAKWIFS